MVSFDPNLYHIIANIHNAINCTVSCRLFDTFLSNERCSDFESSFGSLCVPILFFRNFVFDKWARWLEWVRKRLKFLSHTFHFVLSSHLFLAYEKYCTHVSVRCDDYLTITTVNEWRRSENAIQIFRNVAVRYTHVFEFDTIHMRSTTVKNWTKLFHVFILTALGLSMSMCLCIVLLVWVYLYVVFDEKWRHCIWYCLLCYCDCYCFSAWTWTLNNDIFLFTHSLLNFTDAIFNKSSFKNILELCMQFKTNDELAFHYNATLLMHQNISWYRNELCTTKRELTLNRIQIQLYFIFFGN